MRSFLRGSLRPILLFALVVPCFLFSVPSPNVFAQYTEEEERQIREESVEELRRTESLTAAAARASKLKKGWLFDFGSNVGSGYTASDDNDRQVTRQDDPDHTWDHEGSFFALLTSVSRNTKYYFRSKTSLSQSPRISKSVRQTQYTEPYIDMVYIEQKFEGSAVKSKLTVGRQYAKVGRGIAYGLTADGIHWNSKYKKWDGSVMWMRQKPGDNNIDNLAAGSGRTKRWFFGAEVKNKFRKWMAADAFVLWNMDRNNDLVYPSSYGAGLTQRSQYDSRYFGFGLDGTFFTKLNYWSEYIAVRGSTYDAARAAQTTAAKVGVKSSALDVGVRYLFGGDIAPALFTEYAFGSGDADRARNVTSSNGGSTHGKDSVFRSFGGLSMGHALSPSLANVRIFKAGGSFKPFGRSSAVRFNDMTMTLTGYTYWTYARGGPTSDGQVTTWVTGNPKSDDLGDEYDMTMAWKMFNDLNYQFKYGVFAPGPAYMNRGRETYMKLKVSFDL